MSAGNISKGNLLMIACCMIWLRSRWRETAERLETLLEIGQVLEKLPPLQRWRFILHFFYGYSYSEIAKMQDCNKSAVMRSVHSALKKIRKKVAA